MQALLAFASERFSVLSGDDPTAARAMLAGADGVISVAANVAPAAFAFMCERCAAGDVNAALDSTKSAAAYELLGIEPNPIPLKWCLAELGLGSSQLRLPLVELAAAHHSKGREVLVRPGLIEAARAVS